MSVIQKPRQSFEKKDERQFILELIRVYKSLPALWNTKCKEYGDRTIKAEQYEVLLEKYRERYPGADKHLLTKKINSLRTNFRKELNRLREFAETSSPNDTFETSLWYYADLSFIAENDENPIKVQRIFYDDYENDSMMSEPMSKDPPKKHIKRRLSDYSETEEFIEDSDYCTPPIVVKKNYQKSFMQTNNKSSMNPFAQASRSVTPDESTSIIGEDEYVVTTISEPQQQQSQQRSQTNSQLNISTSQNEFQKIGETWALKLQKMDSQQQIYAEKFINDILFEGLMGTLHRHAVQLNLNVNEMYDDGDDNPLMIEYEPQKKAH